jgi:hypothetical protein
MWWRFKNFFSSLRTYSDLSPDLALRKQINRTLQKRQALAPDEWFATYGATLGISKDLTVFTYTQLTQYSGIEFSRVVPSDRLIEDLHLPLVCWFDWQLAFCEEFWQCFQVDISDYFDIDDFVTVADLLVFLNTQLASATTPSDF